MALLLVVCLLISFSNAVTACIEGCFCRNSPSSIDCLDRGLHDLKPANLTVDRRVLHIFANYNYLRQLNYTALLDHYPNLNTLDVRGNDNFNCSTVPPRRLKVLVTCGNLEEPDSTFSGDGLDYRPVNSYKTALQVAGANLVVILLVGGTYLVSLFIRRKRLQQAIAQTYSVQTAV